MRLDYSPQFLKSWDNTPLKIQKLFEKQAEFLRHNLRHPSLRAKKYDEARDIWQARVNGGWRFYFQIRGDTYYMLNIKAHPK
jgi:mRNA-degrading endonuclease RelE of RelBE toxin-antitoxin system